MNSDFTYAYFSGDYDEMDRLEIEHCLDGFSIHPIASGYFWGYLPYEDFTECE